MVLMRKCFWVALLLLSLACSAAANPSLRVDGERLNDTIEKVKTFGLNENGGSDRIAFSQHNIDSLRYLTDLMEAAGLEVHTDFAGNLIGSHAGRNPAVGANRNGFAYRHRSEWRPLRRHCWRNGRNRGCPYPASARGHLGASVGGRRLV